MFGFSKKAIASSIISGLILISLPFSIATINSGEVGIVYTFGKVENNILQPGLNFKFPFINSVKKLDVRTQTSEQLFESLSKDGQLIKITATSNYNNNPLQAPNTAATIGLVNETITLAVLQPTLSSVVKNVIAEHNMNDIISNQAEISKEIESKVLEGLNRKPNITLTAFNVIGIKLDDQVQEAVEKKIIALQELERAKTENQTAQIRAETNKTISASLTNNLILQEAVRKWDGKSAVFSLGKDNSEVIIQPSR